MPPGNNARTPANALESLPLSRRRQSHLTRWIEDQHKDDPSGVGGINDGMGNLSLNTGVRRRKEGEGRKRDGRRRERAGDEEYDIVDAGEGHGQVEAEELAGLHPETSRTASGRFLQTPSSLKRILRPSTPQPDPPHTVRNNPTSRSSFSVSLLPRILRTPPHDLDPPIKPFQATHTRSSSLSMLFNPNAPDTHHIPQPAPAPPPPATKSRPSVMKHFASAYFLSSDPAPAPAQPTWEAMPRPSLNSVHTCATSHTSTSEANCMRPRTAGTTASSLFSTPAAASSHSLWSTSQGPSGSGRISDDTCDPPLPHPPPGKLLNNGVVRVPLANKEIPPPKKPRLSNDSRTYVAYAPGNHSSFSAFVSSTRGRNYKKLVVSGIGVDEHKRFHGVRRWCESFGEVRCITRMQNGDLHVHFKDPQVADTVCRIRATVYIAGVGSVALSWYTGSKR